LISFIAIDVPGWDRPKRNREEEMAQIIETDSSMPEEEEEEGGDEEEGKLVYIVSVSWVNAWLAFVHTMKSSPEPGRCDNSILLERDEEQKCWVPLPDMVLARRSKRGDYRHVTMETWKHIAKLYPNSGPAIKVEAFVETGDHKADGLYETAAWVIDMKGFDPVDKAPKKKKKPSRKELSSVDQPSAEMTPMRPSNMGERMEDDEHKVDDRMGKFFGEKNAVPGQESPAKPGPPGSSPTYNPLGGKDEVPKKAAKRGVS
jgi:hypothetical protein